MRAKGYPKRYTRRRRRIMSQNIRGQLSILVPAGETLLGPAKFLGLAQGSAANETRPCRCRYIVLKFCTAVTSAPGFVKFAMEEPNGNGEYSSTSTTYVTSYESQTCVLRMNRGANFGQYIGDQKLLRIQTSVPISLTADAKFEFVLVDVFF